ncbi:MAG: hypothetical protein R3240_00380 [Gammaproteobacteria bacterium]|nr:hypothetical protein [Gammaproteobacteria bacterium]
MKNHSFKNIAGSIGIIALSSATAAQTGDQQKWFFSAGAALTTVSYSNSQLFSQQNNGKLLLTADYLEKTRLRFAGGYATYDYQGSNSQYKQNITGLSGKQTFYFDILNGSTSLQAYFKSLWLQLGATFINTSNSDNFQSLQTSLTWFISYKNRFYPTQLTIGISNGKQQYFFDDNYWLVYNSADIQTGAVFAAASWQFKDSIYVSLNMGRENFIDTTDVRYELNYLSSTIFTTW